MYEHFSSCYTMNRNSGQKRDEICVPAVLTGNMVIAWYTTVALERWDSHFVHSKQLQFK